VCCNLVTGRNPRPKSIDLRASLVFEAISLCRTSRIGFACMRCELPALLEVYSVDLHCIRGMAPSVQSFEDYLYNVRAVYVDSVSETARTLSLLDVLVKNDSESTSWFSKPHPVLVRRGSMKDVGIYSKPKDQQGLHDGLEEFDKCTREGLGMSDAL
jgi:hypothetical protein